MPTRPVYGHLQSSHGRDTSLSMYTILTVLYAHSTVVPHFQATLRRQHVSMEGVTRRTTWWTIVGRRMDESKDRKNRQRAPPMARHGPHGVLCPWSRSSQGRLPILDMIDGLVPSCLIHHREIEHAASHLPTTMPFLSKRSAITLLTSPRVHVLLRQ